MSNEANAYVKPVYEDWMSEDDIAIYEELISLGRTQLGKEIAKNEDYLLHFSAMITLKQKKGRMLDMNDEDVKKLKQIHKEHQEAGLLHETPPNEWYYSPENPINQPYIPAEVQKTIDEIDASTSNLVAEVIKKTSDIQDEPVDDEIKKGYVKIVSPEPEAEF
jgi:hypothetical protein